MALLLTAVCFSKSVMCSTPINHYSHVWPLVSTITHLLFSTSTTGSLVEAPPFITLFTNCARSDHTFTSLNITHTHKHTQQTLRLEEFSKMLKGNDDVAATNTVTASEELVKDATASATTEAPKCVEVGTQMKVVNCPTCNYCTTTSTTGRLVEGSTL